MPMLFLSPGCWGPTWVDQVVWCAQAGLKNDSLELELLRAYLKYKTSMSEAVVLVHDSYILPEFIKAWGNPKYRFTSFDLALAKKVYEGE